MNTRDISEAALMRGDIFVVDLGLKFLNTFLRSALFSLVVIFFSVIFLVVVVSFPSLSPFLNIFHFIHIRISLNKASIRTACTVVHQYSQITGFMAQKMSTLIKNAEEAKKKNLIMVCSIIDIFFAIAVIAFHLF